MKPQMTPMTDEDLLVHPEMVDEDNLQMGVEAQFKANADLQEGVSGRKKIDTMYENTSVDVVDSPREGSTPAPVCLNSGMYPHRRL